MGYNFQSDRVHFKNRFKWEVFKQSDYEKRPLEEQDLRETASFFGILNKIDYTFDVGPLKFQPRWKSEFQRQRPSRREDTQVRVATTELHELWSLVLRLPILSRTELQTGLEYLLVEQFREKLENDQLRSDRTELVYAMQITNNADYLGYNLWTQTGFRVSRIDRASADKARTETAMFVTVFAGLE
jgi:cytochrome c-type biogenesis protein CcmH/NrfG